MGDRLSSVFGVAVLAAIIGLSGTIAEVGAIRQATPAADASAIDDVAPEELLSALLGEPFPEALLPAGFEDPQVLEWEEGDTDLEGSLGGVAVHLSSEDGSIAYIVFPETRGAQRRLAETTDAAVAPNGAIVDSFAGLSVDGVDYPGRLIVYPDYAVCFVVVGPVVVLGGGFSADPAVRRTTAVAMAEAGVAHLLSLVAGPPDATPPAVASPEAVHRS